MLRQEARPDKAVYVQIAVPQLLQNTAVDTVPEDSNPGSGIVHIVLVHQLNGEMPGRVFLPAGVYLAVPVVCSEKAADDVHFRIPPFPAFCP